MAQQKLNLSLLGGLRIQLDETAVTGLASRKAEALLVYLTRYPRPHPRDKLAALLWGDRPQQRALGNLSVLLSSLRKQLAPFLVANRQEIGVNPASDFQLDAAEFERIINEVRVQQRRRGGKLSRTAVSLLETAVSLYQGDFLSGFYLRDAPDFEEWALLERERLHRLAVRALADLAASFLARGHYRRGIACAGRLLKLDPLQEESHRQMMRLLALDGQRSAALAQYESCRQTLDTELGIPPDETTTALRQQILDGELSPPASPAAGKPTAVASLPQASASFIGRADELAYLKRRLDDPECRLVTITGPGGIGKSRLALQAASQTAADFLDGGAFVSLAGLETADFLVPAIAESLGFALTGRTDPQTELIDFLQPKEMLLVLDNFETMLLEPGAEKSVDLLLGIIKRAADVKLWVTSRERLHIQAEWLLALTGLDYPQADEPAALADYSAVQLFLRRARQIRPDFVLTPDDAPAVRRICRLAQGMPLALELAAAWVRVYTCTEIAGEIESNLAFLSTSLRDVPARHRSVEAVFAHSWRLLTPDERAVYARLAVFRGGFQTEAAQVVAGASLAQLTNFLDKSLLRRAGDGRFTIHGLLSQFAEKKLAREPEAYDALRGRQARYYGRLLQQNESDFYSNRQKQRLDAISADIDNVRRAWGWAAARRDAAVLGQCLESILFAYDIWGWYEEARELIRTAVAALKQDARQPEDDEVYGRLLSVGGWFEFRMGHNREAVICCREALAILQPLTAHFPVGHTLVFLGGACFGLSDFAAAHDNFQAAYDAYEKVGFRWGMSSALGNIAENLASQGDWKRARPYAQRAFAMACEIDTAYLMVHQLCLLGAAAQMEGDYAEARRCLEQSLALCRDLQYPSGEANTLGVLGELAFAVEDYQAARQHFRASAAILGDIGNRLDLLEKLVRLGSVAIALADEQEARDALHEALREAMAIGTTAVALKALTEMAQLYVLQENPIAAAELCAFALGHEAMTTETKETAVALWRRLADELDPQLMKSLEERVQTYLLEDIVADVLGMVQKPAKLA